ncbi:hypothetical protein NDU88_004970 [Pleurodeles waltl]|uniref:Uncharacterized protein n=1 Tax=Pleurodeles waltl TaxID=8319 RepID=A0AAV7NQ21_PLEWA|nr:hypothetical protein NDU88_004970 [Pleurodeles waltl]
MPVIICLFNSKDRDLVLTEARCLFNFKDRDLVLREARSRGDLLCNGTKVLLFPDYTLEVQQQRRSFMEVKQKVRSMDIQYHLLFPARLRVIYNNKTYFFEQPTVAWTWLTEETPLDMHRTGSRPPLKTTPAHPRGQQPMRSQRTRSRKRRGRHRSSSGSPPWAHRSEPRHPQSKENSRATLTSLKPQDTTKIQLETQEDSDLSRSPIL